MSLFGTSKYEPIKSLEHQIRDVLEAKFKKNEAKDEDEMEKDEPATDPVDKAALKKKFKDRKDKDIDNDGDEDDSDEYLHKRRQAITKGMDEAAENPAGEGSQLPVATKKTPKRLADKLKAEGVDLESMSDEDFDTFLEGTDWDAEELDAIEEGVLGAVGSAVKSVAKGAVGLAKKAVYNKQGNARLSTAGRADSAEKKLAAIRKKKADQQRMATAKAAIAKERGQKSESVDLNKANVDKALKHDCATHVEHAEYGKGTTVKGMHTLEQISEDEAVVTHYDVMFENEEGPFIKEMVPVSELNITKSESHMHKKKK